MAKKSAIENNLRKQRLAKKFAARRKRLLDLANDQAASDGGALRGAHPSGGAAAQRRDHSRAQSLRSDRTAARLSIAR